MAAVLALSVVLVAMNSIIRKISYDPLWKKLIDAKLTKTELAKAVGISRTTVSKMGKNEPVGLDVILKICNHLDCGIEDVVEILPGAMIQQGTDLDVAI